jgi:GT2 family glycosyltransferase
MQPTVTIVFLVHNRREELRTSLRKMLEESDYPAERVDAIVVDNASDDGSAAMVREEFPHVRLIERDENVGVSAWNDGFAVARGDWVLALDDDCYLPPDGLRRAIAAAGERAADLVSFSVSSSFDPSYRYDLSAYRTGLLTFWGCAVLMRREVLASLGGFDPDVFIWAHELEFMLRFFDRGFRHLHMPEVTAVHMKYPEGHWTGLVRSAAYVNNARHWAYIAAKHLRARDALETLIALIAVHVRDGLSVDRRAFRAAPVAVAGFARGLRRRGRPVRADISRAYRHNLESFASPWWFSRPPRELLRAAPRELARALTGREVGVAPPTDRGGFYDERRRYYPQDAATLEF